MKIKRESLLPQLFLPEAMSNMLLGKISVPNYKVSISETRVETWIKRLADSQIIILNHQQAIELKENEYQQTPNISLPFTNCFFTFHNAEGIVSPLGNSYFAQLTHEAGPNQFETLIVTYLDGNLFFSLQEKCHSDLDFFSSMFCTLLDRSKAVGVEHWPLRTKVKRFGIKSFSHESLIYISANTLSFKSPMSSLPVDWKTKWWVRGHWVTISTSSLGKDRNGNRNIFGKTWRLHHEKGNPCGVPINQTRIIK